MRPLFSAASLLAASLLATPVPGKAVAGAPLSSFFDGVEACLADGGPSDDIAPVGWLSGAQRGSGSPCCADPCRRHDPACGDACGCGGGLIAAGPPCRKNTGLIGRGILTYDPCSAGCELPGKLLGCFHATERDFDDFISPMTNPVFFEDPRSVTEIRGVFLQHRVPQTALGGDIQLYAVQLRARLSERLSLIATKDGYIVSDNPLIQDGWADVDLGLKYALLRDVENQRLLSAGLAYNLPVGATRTQQARGDGVFHLFTTGGTQLGRCGHWVSQFGGIIPANQNANSSFLYWSNHFDHQFRRGWYAVMEYNWFHYAVDGGDGGAGLVGLDGGDLFNLGSTGVAGNDIVTGAWGLKHKPNRNTEIGVAFETPLTKRRDVLESRLTVDAIFRY